MKLKHGEEALMSVLSLTNYYAEKVLRISGPITLPDGDRA